MTKMISLTGKRFGKLLVLERAESSNSGRTRWRCKCDCGSETIVDGFLLRNGKTKSCGCLKYSKRNGYINEKNKRLHSIWANMKSRCNNKNSKSYSVYGGKGIKVCKDWEKFLDFQNWAIANGYSDELTIERLDVNKNYCPENCCWIPKSEQAKNRTCTYKIMHNGKEKNLTELCKELNLNYKRIHNRIHKLGWNVEKAINTEISTSKRNKKARNKYGDY